MDQLDVYLDELRKYKEGHDIPQFSSKDGRTKAKVLFLQRDRGNSGASKSGVVGRDNDYRTAKNFKEANASLDRKLAISWNIVPWPASEGAFAPQVEDALPWLGKLLDLLRELRVVVLLGNDAQKATRYCTCITLTFTFSTALTRVSDLRKRTRKRRFGNAGLGWRLRFARLTSSSRAASDLYPTSSNKGVPRPPTWQNIYSARELPRCRLLVTSVTYPA